MPRAITMSENALQQHVVRLLTAYGRPDIAWWHCPNGEWRDPRTAARLKKMGVKAGAPDIMMMIDGRFHGLELKTERGRVSKVQEEFCEAIERAGGFFHVAFGIDEAIGALNALYAFRDGIRIKSATLDGVGGARESGSKRGEKSDSVHSLNSFTTRRLKWQYPSRI